MFKQCVGCDIGDICYKCWERYEKKYYCIDCDVNRREIKRHEKCKIKAQKMLDEWISLNPYWQSDQKAAYMEKCSEEWEKSKKQEFLKNKLDTYMKLLITSKNIQNNDI